MSRKKRIKDSKKEIEDGINRINEDNKTGSGNIAYSMSRVIFFQNKVLEEKLDDLSERLTLIETALGLLGTKKDES